MSLAKLVNWYTHNLENMVNSMYKHDKGICFISVLFKPTLFSNDSLFLLQFYILLKVHLNFYSEFKNKNLNHVFKKKKITSSLRGTLKTQAGRFVSRFHEDKMANLTDLLKTEMWKQVIY